MVPQFGNIKAYIGFANNLNMILNIGLTIIIYVRGHNNSIVKNKKCNKKPFVLLLGSITNKSYYIKFGLEKCWVLNKNSNKVLATRFVKIDQMVYIK